MIAVVIYLLVLRNLIPQVSGLIQIGTTINYAPSIIELGNYFKIISYKDLNGRIVDTFEKLVIESENEFLDTALLVEKQVRSDISLLLKSRKLKGHAIWIRKFELHGKLRL